MLHDDAPNPGVRDALAAFLNLVAYEARVRARCGWGAGGGDGEGARAKAAGCERGERLAAAGAGAA
jgi:hypothetical protein